MLRTPDRLRFGISPSTRVRGHVAPICRRVHCVRASMHLRVVLDTSCTCMSCVHLHAAFRPVDFDNEYCHRCQDPTSGSAAVSRMRAELTTRRRSGGCACACPLEARSFRSRPQPDARRRRVRISCSAVAARAHRRRPGAARVRFDSGPGPRRTASAHPCDPGTRSRTFGHRSVAPDAYQVHTSNPALLLRRLLQ